MEKRIITISREFGSGGRTIGKLVAEHLGIRCYDAELIQKLAAESGFDENYIKEAGEYTPGGFLASAFTNRSFGPTNEDLLWKLRFWIWQKKSPASLWDAAPILSCRTAPTA